MRWTIGAAVLLCARAAWPQTFTATIRGVVTDSSGAVVAGAVVTLTHIEQNRGVKYTTSQSGEYEFLQAPPGTYTLTAEAAGFKKYERRGMTLEVAQVAQIDIRLEVGAVTESVEITAQAPLLEAASSTLGEVVNSKSADALPLNGRNALQLVALTPGINTTSSFRTASTSNGNIAAVGFSANGGRNVANEVMLDGSSQIVMGYNQPAYVPTPDALQEFKVQTNNLSAEYGRTGGAVVNLVHRSGTSEFHGVLYEFLSNDKFDSKNFFDNLNGKPKAPFRYNQFGFTLGGPLTKSRQSTFFFINYEGIREVQPTSTVFTVPTAKMKLGNFTETGVTIYDPATVDPAGSRSPFPGNIIPSNRFDPVALKILSYYPTPTLPGIANNFFSQLGADTISNNVSTKLDRRISDRQSLFGRFSWNNIDAIQPNFFGNVASPEAGVSGTHNDSATLDDTYVLGRWILHGNYGYAYAANPRASVTNSFDSTTLGLPASVKTAEQYLIFPRVDATGFASLGGDNTWIIGNKFETHTWSADASHLTGGHSIKFGGVYRLNKVSNFRPNAPAGNYQFDEAFTRSAIVGNQGGNAIASMLLGVMSGGSLSNLPSLALEVPYVGAYLQDDWRVSKRLTVNLGLRWDSDRPMTERFNRLTWFDYNAALPVQVPGLPPLHGGLEFVARNGAPRGDKNPDNNNFAPRLGVAYKITEHVVLRSGLGVFYSPTTGIGPSLNSVGALSFDATTPITTTIDSGRTAFATLSNPFPGGFNQPTNGSLGLLTLLGQSVNAIDRGDRTPYTVQWNFDVQYELPDDMLLDVAYAGNAGVKQLAQANLDQLPDADLALGSALTQSVTNPFFGIIPATSSVGQRTTTLGQLLRPYPQFTGVTHTWGSFAHSSYHSLQVKFRKRYRGGLQLLAAYTWSKMLDDYSSVAGFLGQANPAFADNNNMRADRSLSSLDIAHRLVANYEYELPFGKGRRFLNRGVMSYLVGGWSLNGITTLQSGLPLSITSAANTTNSLGGLQRPNSTGQSTITAGSIEDRLTNYFNKAAFANPRAYTFGNLGRFLPDNRAPHLIVSDLSVIKSIRLGEKRRLDYRAELFNMFNHPNFQGPTGNGTIFGQPQFGVITTAEPARIIQMALKLYF
jgi:hypothetical protein